mmetsp:Transcript_12890/g.30434  ORF Transcript_12890/g.30434 Transcript_12890/m.30434 type:complete len:202 (+) Transcript_12890:829-1434(+)
MLPTRVHPRPSCSLASAECSEPKILRRSTVRGLYFWMVLRFPLSELLGYPAKLSPRTGSPLKVTSRFSQDMCRNVTLKYSENFPFMSYRRFWKGSTTSSASMGNCIDSDRCRLWLWSGKMLRYTCPRKRKNATDAARRLMIPPLADWVRTSARGFTKTSTFRSTGMVFLNSIDSRIRRKTTSNAGYAFIPLLASVSVSGSF